LAVQQLIIIITSTLFEILASFTVADPTACVLPGLRSARASLTLVCVIMDITSRVENLFFILEMLRLPAVVHVLMGRLTLAVSVFTDQV